MARKKKSMTQKAKSESDDIPQQCAGCGHCFFDLPYVKPGESISAGLKCKYCLADESLPKCEYCGTHTDESRLYHGWCLDCRTPKCRCGEPLYKDTNSCWQCLIDCGHDPESVAHEMDPRNQQEDNDEY